MLPLARGRELAREKSFRREAGKFDLDRVELKLLMLTSISKQTVLFVLKNTSKKKKKEKHFCFAGSTWGSAVWICRFFVGGNWSSALSPTS